MILKKIIIIKKRVEKSTYKKIYKSCIPIEAQWPLEKKKVSIEKNNLAFYNFVCVVKAIL